jgi:hypothetical protein
LAELLVLERIRQAGKRGVFTYNGMGRRFTYLFRAILCAAPFGFLLQDPEEYDSEYEDLDHVADRRMREAHKLYEETLPIIISMGKDLIAIMQQAPPPSKPRDFLEGFMDELFCQEICLDAMFKWPSLSFCELDVYEVTNAIMPWKKAKPDFSMCVWHPCLKDALGALLKKPYFLKYPEHIPLLMQPANVIDAAKQEARKRSNPLVYTNREQKRQRVENSK